MATSMRSRSPAAGRAEGRGSWTGKGKAKAEPAAPRRRGRGRRRRGPRPPAAEPLLQPIPVLQLLGQVLLGDEADAAPGQRLQLELLPAAHHLLDLALPLRLLEPGVGQHLLGAV